MSTFNQVVQRSYRIANRLDLVPMLPLPPDYDHVEELFDLNPIQFLPLPPRILVNQTLTCEHALTTYLHLLSVLSGGPVLPLDPACVP